MREIKFRAWDFLQEVIIDDARFVIEANGTVWWRPCVEHEDYISEMMEKAYDNIEIMQFTGLFDKNGVEIYEGDIVEIKNLWTNGVGKWSHFVGKIIFFESEFQAKDENDNYISLYRYKPRIEVIGNIYKNPELLEEK